MPKAYWISAYQEVRNPDALAAYAKLAGPALAAPPSKPPNLLEEIRDGRRFCEAPQPVNRLRPCRLRRPGIASRPYIPEAVPPSAAGNRLPSLISQATRSMLTVPAVCVSLT